MASIVGRIPGIILLTLAGVQAKPFAPAGPDRCRFVRAHTDPGAARPEPVIQAFAVGRSAPTGFL
jgi:hypothetical protein